MKLSENSLLKYVPSLFLRHIGGVILCCIFFIPASGSLTDTIGQIIWSVVFLIAYSIPQYVAFWSIGNKDLNAYRFGHIKKDAFKGFKIGLIISIPSFIMAILFILSKFSLFYNFTIPFKFLNAEILPLINLIQRSMYMPDFTVPQVLGVAALTLIPSILCGIFYQIGFRDFTPSQWIIYKNEKAKKNNTTEMK